MMYGVEIGGRPFGAVHPLEGKTRTGRPTLYRTSTFGILPLPPDEYQALVAGKSLPDLQLQWREQQAAAAYGPLLPYPWDVLQSGQPSWFELALSVPIRGALRGLHEYQIKEILWWLYENRAHAGVDQMVMSLMGMPEAVPQAAAWAWQSMTSDQRQRFNDWNQQVGATLAQQAYSSYTPAQLKQHAADMKASIELTGNLPGGADLVIGPTTSTGKEAWQVFESKTAKGKKGIIEQLTTLALVIGAGFVGYQLLK